MLHMNTSLAIMYDLQACSFLQTYSLKQGIKKSGEKGISYARKEMRLQTYIVLDRDNIIVNIRGKLVDILI